MLRRVATAVLSLATLAAGGYFLWAATRPVPDPRPAMAAAFDELAMPGAVPLHERTTGGAECDDTGCPTVERWWASDVDAGALCPRVRSAVSDWGGIRFQRLGTATCGYLGVRGADRLAFTVAPATRARLPRGVSAAKAASVVHVALTRD